MGKGFLQDKTGDKSCKRLGGLILIGSGILLDCAISLATVLGKSEALALKGMSAPMYGFGAALIGSGVIEAKYMNK